MNGAAAGAWSGRSVSGGGDVTGDGIDDVIIETYNASPYVRANAGAVYVYCGSFSSDVDLFIYGFSYLTIIFLLIYMLFDVFAIARKNA